MCCSAFCIQLPDASAWSVGSQVLGNKCLKGTASTTPHSDGRTVLNDHAGCVKSFRASVRYLTAAGMSSKPRLLAANFVSLHSRQLVLGWQMKGLQSSAALERHLAMRACHACDATKLRLGETHDKLQQQTQQVRGLCKGWTSLVRLSDSRQAGLEAISWCRDGRLAANRAATAATTNATATATCRAFHQTCASAMVHALCVNSCAHHFGIKRHMQCMAALQLIQQWEAWRGASAGQSSSSHKAARRHRMR